MSAGPQGRLTKPGTTPLSEIARHIVKPDGITSTGWPAAREVCRTLSLTFDQWQDGGGRLILAKKADGLYAADLVVISIPRQVGKTFLIGCIIFALCIIFPGLTVIWTAHRFKLARETFDSMRSMARRPGMFPHIDPKAITTAAGNEAIPFRNGSRILFGAREQGFGLGFSKVGVLVLDECQRLSQTTMDDLVPTTNQHPNPLIILTGTPPRPKDDGEIFAGLRADALSGESEEVLYIELSADPDFEPTPLPLQMTDADWEQIAKVNPSFPHRTSRRAIKRMRKILGTESMKREGYGIWDDDSSGWKIVSSSTWRTAGRPAGHIDAQPKLAIAATPDLSFAALGAAAIVDGELWVKLLAHGAGVTWLVEKAKAAQEKHGGTPIIVDAGGPCSSLIPRLVDAGVLLEEVGGGEVCDAAAVVVTAITEQDILRHQGQAELDAAMKAADWRDVGDRRAFGRRKSTGDICPLESVSLAALFAIRSSTDVWGFWQ